MSALSLALLIGVLVMLIIIVAFVFTVKSGQYDDMEGPAYRILMDDDDPLIPANAEKLRAERQKKEQPNESDLESEK
ncbi:MAG TPA: cbb3-type cytochrome oxidase assembly protein CcoS [Leucothrix mucor]|uniref:Cbb3-type cytochrome oxidase assembly protein CcoS n=1 Tax=Leucothrix mucor TaxID=45248 RepID=A0A7V2WTP6_LEUMU|nr:cbb3-type cytochrome oxidase assembly protein CcoS [Leucothrix mucor]